MNEYFKRMEKVIVSEFYDPPRRKFFPIQYPSKRKVCFGDNEVIEFDFKSRLVFVSASSQARELARIEGGGATCASIKDFRGKITTPQFCLSVEKGGFFSGPSLELAVGEQSGNARKVKFNWIFHSGDFNFMNLVKCHDPWTGDQLEVSYVPKMEDLARVISAVLYHLKIVGRGTLM